MYAATVARSIAMMSVEPTILIALNGVEVSVPAATSIASLVQRTLPNARAYAVELNRVVLARRDHGTRLVAAGDHVEIVTLVGGG